MYKYYSNDSKRTCLIFYLPQILQHPQLLFQGTLLSQNQVNCRGHTNWQYHQGISSVAPRKIGEEGREQKSMHKRGRRVLSKRTVNQQTHSFYVTFSEEKIIFNTACIFKLEYTCGKQYKTYIDFELACTSVKRQQNNAGQQTSRKVSICDRRRVYINGVTCLNTFKRILFDDVDYFSFSDIYLISQSMGEKVRINEYQLLQFKSMDMQSRQIKHHEAFERQMGLQMQKNKLFRQAFHQSSEQFYVRMITEKVMRYRKLCMIYQKFKFFMTTLASSNTSEGNQLPELQWIKTDTFLRENELMEHYQTQDIPELFMLIYQESHQIIRNVKYLWQLIAQLLLSVNFQLIDQLAALDVSNQQQTKAMWLLTYSNITRDERQQNKKRFLKKREDILGILNVYEDMDVYHPFLIIQNHNAEQLTTKQAGDIDSLVVFVHGYQGSSVDLEKARNFMNIYNPCCYGLLIKSIQDYMDEPIEILGQMVADEVMNELMKTHNNYKHINFIGYSLGGILARQAVKHLEKYKDLMNIFISFASPHAGICDASNPLVKTGIWFLTNFEKNKNLKQLNCQRNEITQDITLQNLSVCSSLSWFNKFVAVSSRQDDFVPYESSRLQEQNLKEITRQICVNIKQRIRKLERVDVWFDVEHCVGTIDRMTGRRAHIQFLQNRLFLDCFFSIYAPLF